MASGPGKYDDLATVVRVRARAQGVIVIVIGGDKGNGFAAQFTSPEYQKELPYYLRQVADEIERTERS